MQTKAFSKHSCICRKDTLMVLELHPRARTKAKQQGQHGYHNSWLSCFFFLPCKDKTKYGNLSSPKHATLNEDVKARELSVWQTQPAHSKPSFDKETQISTCVHAQTKVRLLSRERRKGKAKEVRRPCKGSKRQHKRKSSCKGG